MIVFVRSQHKHSSINDDVAIAISFCLICFFFLFLYFLLLHTKYTACRMRIIQVVLSILAREFVTNHLLCFRQTNCVCQLLTQVTYAVDRRPSTHTQQKKGFILFVASTAIDCIWPLTVPFAISCFPSFGKSNMGRSESSVGSTMLTRKWNIMSSNFLWLDFVAHGESACCCRTTFPQMYRMRNEIRDPSLWALKWSWRK